MPYIINLRAKVISKNDSIWRIFPGVNYKHYDVMRENSRVFLQYYDAPMPNDGSYEETHELLEVLAYGEARTNAAIRENYPKLTELTQEAHDQKLSWSQSRKLAKGWLQGLYADARVGDLVVMPGPGWRKSEGSEWLMKSTLVGEIVGEPERWTENGPAGYLAARLLTRRVKWLTEVVDHDLPATTTKSLRTQNTLIKLPAESMDRVVSAAYKNVIVGEEVLAQFSTTNAEFRSDESFHFQAFVMAIVSAYEAYQNGNILDQNKSIYDLAATAPADHSLIPEQNANIHSPGYTTLKSVTKIPLIVAALYALAAEANAEPFNADGSVSVEVAENVHQQPLDCKPLENISEDVKATLAQIGYLRWKQMCKSREAASADGGLTSVAEVNKIEE